MQTQIDGSSLRELTDLSLEELAQIEVTSATHVPANQWDLPQTIFVITQQDLSNHGISHLAEALRLVPAIHVARTTSNSWATGLRGFSDDLSRAILVLVDGRSVYNNLFAGVFWADQDLPIDLIDRIEVILGPGGSVWGANAVHGVINIITKSADKTQGGYFSAAAGNVEEARTTLRYGDTLGQGHYRLWGQYTQDAAARHRDGVNFDSWNTRKIGLRTDQEIGTASVSVQAGFAASNQGQRSPVPDSTGTRTISPVSRTQTEDHFVSAYIKTKLGELQWRTKAFYQREDREVAILSYEIETLDLETDFVSENPWGTSSFGMSLRKIHDHTIPTQSLELTPANEDQLIKGLFFEHHAWLFHRKVLLNLGTKVEDSTYTDWEWQPRVGASYFPNGQWMVWTSLARAIRAPSRLERNINSYILTQQDRLLVRFQGSEDFRAEVLEAVEVGTRLAWNNHSFSLALFQQKHDHLVSTEAGAFTTDTTPYGVRPILLVQTGNGINATSVGGDLNWSFWPEGIGQFSLRYAYQNLDVTLDPTSRDFSARLVKGVSPRHQVLVTSMIPWRPWLKWQTSLRWVDALPSQNISAYWEADSGLHFALGQDLKLGIFGRNLLHKEHVEFNPNLAHQRQVVAELNWRW